MATGRAGYGRMQKFHLRVGDLKAPGEGLELCVMFLVSLSGPKDLHQKAEESASED